MILVIGPNNSGKSAIAENLACHLRVSALSAATAGHAYVPQPSLIYMATMVPVDDEGRRRVAAHRAARSGLGFLTIESPLAEVAPYSDVIGPDDTILLEDVSNLLANLIFTAHDEDPVSTAREHIRRLEESSRHLISVSIGGLLPGPGMDKETCSYITALARLNSILTEDADQVIHT